MKYVRILIGLVVWITAALLLSLWLNEYLFAPRSDGHRMAGDLWEFATAERRVVKLQLDGDWPIAAGDPIYRVDARDAIEQVGEIRRVYDPPSEEARHAPGPVAEALLYPHAPALCDRSHLTYYTTPQSLAWVMETMLPPEKQIRIAQEILYTYEEHHREILDALKPIVMGGLFDAMEVVEQDLTTALSRRREQLENLGSRYQDRVVEQDIVPLVRQEIWPIVTRNAEPLANEIGKEMFQRASLWRFGWRLLYDKSFLPEKNLTQEEWNRFVREEGMPVLDSHSSDMVAVQRQILEEVAKNEQVRDAVRRNLSRVIDDPEFRAIVWQVFREVLVDNPRLHQRLEQRWQTAEAREAVQLAADYVEPCVRRIGDLLFGTREAGHCPRIRPGAAQPDSGQGLPLAGAQHAHLIRSPSKRSQPIRLLPVRLGGYPDVNPFAVQLQGVK